MTDSMRKIAVLMATCNGMPWLPEQMDSILRQQGVDVTVWVSDDASKDGTREWLEEQIRCDARIKLLPAAGPFGSAARNFFRLVLDAGWQDADYVAFSDQDDVWLPRKLLRQSELLSAGKCMAVSSSVIACWADGRRTLIDKAQEPTTWDFVFESAGPGCTYLMRPELLRQMQGLLEEENNPARDCALHDWLAYAICRAQRKDWKIDPEPGVLYRQHGNNEFGAHVGMRAAWGRLRRSAGGWHRQEAGKIVSSVLPLVQDQAIKDGLMRLQGLLEEHGLISRLRLLKYAVQGRRRFMHRVALGMMVTSGIW